MNTALALLKITRPANCLMAACAVGLGFWLGHSALPLPSLGLLMLAAVCATAFGNVINDLRDISTDRVSHPDRPLVTGVLSAASAAAFATLLGAVSLGAGFLVSPQHGIATFMPIVILTAYAFLFKATPFAGNILVGSLVAYPLLYGALGSSQISRLYIPALLAFLLNFGREIVKDLQDAPGDQQAHLRTTAAVAPSTLRVILIVVSLIYLSCLLLPYGLRQFGIVYVLVCIALVVPFHATRTVTILSKPWISNLAPISLLYKLEMVAGLIALAADTLLPHTLP